MVQPQRAPVRPRVIAPVTGEIVLLEDEILQLLESGARGTVAVVGPAGSGKTTALAHLAAVLPDQSQVFLILIDREPPPGTSTPGAGLIVCAAPTVREENIGRVYQLVPWGRDDWLEYLLAKHRPRCAAVMARLKASDQAILGGSPELWSALLDRLAADDSIPDARRALHQLVREHLGDTDLIERARSVCLNSLTAPDFNLVPEVRRLARPGFDTPLVHLLKHEAVRMLLAAERIAADLHGEADCDYLSHALPRNLVRTVASLCAADTEAQEHLRRLLAGPSWSHAMAASLMHAMRVGWVPSEPALTDLCGAYLEEVDWPEVDLAGTRFNGADLRGANLRGAILVRSQAGRALFGDACLQRAQMTWLQAPEADLSGADLSGAWAAETIFRDACLAGAKLTQARIANSDLSGADLRGADLSGAYLRGTNLEKANLSGAILAGANLRQVRLQGAILKNADFRGADLTGARLSQLNLREARWEEACFRYAEMEQCDLEGLLLPAADMHGARLQGALLTLTVMPGADFGEADLRNTGLAEVDWEGADLRLADLRGASFHLGSTRSGLVGSPLASEGSRTGFYTDEYEEQGFKPPEEIRKANLCRADLRCTLLIGVDFYLVDLRGALYDSVQAEHLRHSGAILGAGA